MGMSAKPPITTRSGAAGGRPGHKVFTVTELNATVRYLLDEAFDEVWIEGEISNLSTPSSGHWYFTLKDKGAQVRCAMFRLQNRRVRLAVRNGVQVRIRCEVGLFEARGEFQLVAQHMEHAGAGALAAAFQALKERLGAEGLFESSRKRPLPEPTQHLVIITSSTGAAIRDVQKVLAARCPLLPVTLIPVVVQGTEAPRNLRRALATVPKLAQIRPELPPPDLVLLTRGGGSMEDLWGFNHEGLAHAIAHSTVPVLTGIGHETDQTIADLVADRSAPTPSAAAVLASPDQEGWTEQLREGRSRLRRAVAASIQRAGVERRELVHRLRAPRRLMQGHAQELDDLERRLLRQTQRQVQHGTVQLAALRPRLTHPHQRWQRSAQDLNQLRQRLVDNVQHRIRGAAQETTLTRSRLINPGPLIWQLTLQTDQLRHRLLANTPMRRITTAQSTLDGYFERSQRAVGTALHRNDTALAAAASHLQAVSPLQTISRGYSVLTQTSATSEREVATSVTQLVRGGAVTAWLSDGAAKLRVEDIEPEATLVAEGPVNPEQQGPAAPGAADSHHRSDG